MPALQGLISGVPTGALVMLDLYAEVQPQWAPTEGFYGAPFIWCMLHNFGGNLGAPPPRARPSFVERQPRHRVQSQSIKLLCSPLVWYAMRTTWAFRHLLAAVWSIGVCSGAAGLTCGAGRTARMPLAGLLSIWGAHQ